MEIQTPELGSQRNRNTHTSPGLRQSRQSLLVTLRSRESLQIRTGTWGQVRWLQPELSSMLSRTVLLQGLGGLCGAWRTRASKEGGWVVLVLSCHMQSVSPELALQIASGL